MSVQKKPMYVFENINDTGIHEVPETRVIHVENTNELYIKKVGSSNNMGPNTTVTQAIANGSLVKLWTTENDGPYSGLESQSATYWGTQNGGTGYRLINVSTAEPLPNVGELGDIWFQRDA